LVPEATVGRMAKELDIEGVEQLFRMDHETFSRESLEISSQVLERLGGYSGLIDRFPFDRGDTNKALILLCLRIADVVGRTDATTAQSLRSAAIQIGAGATYAGSKRPQGQLEELVLSVRRIVERLPEDLKIEAGTSGQSLEERMSPARRFLKYESSSFSRTLKEPATCGLHKRIALSATPFSAGRRETASLLKCDTPQPLMMFGTPCWMTVTKYFISPGTATSIHCCLKTRPAKSPFHRSTPYPRSSPTTHP